MIRSITPFLWYDENAEAAARFYTSIFSDSAIESTSPLVTTFTLHGQRLMALNGGPHHNLTPAFSLFVSVDTQAEVDRLWETLSAGGEKSRCGWVRDKFGLSWQIVPAVLGELLGDDNESKSEAVMAAMLQMGKLDIAGLQRAYDAA